MDNLTGKMLLDALLNLSDDELNSPVMIFDNEYEYYKGLKGIVPLDHSIVIAYNLSNNKE